MNPPTLAEVKGRPLLLFVDHTVPLVTQFAGSRTNYLYLELLVEMGLEVVFLPADFKRPAPWSGQLEALGIRILGNQGDSDDWRSWLDSNGRNLDFVFLNKPEPANQFLEDIVQNSDAAIIYQCHDLHFLRKERQASLLNDPEAQAASQKLRNLEDFAIAASDVVLTFSRSESEVIQEHWPEADVVTVPLYFFDQPPQPLESFTERKGLVFVGSCEHEPNHDGLTWFCDEVLPRVQQSVPDITFDIVGSNPPPDIRDRQSDAVRVAGHLSDEELLKTYAQARIMVVPLRFGAGVKGKVVEALHYGLPIVSTTIGLEGIPGLETFLQPRDSAEQFAEEIITLYSDPKRLERIAESGQALAGSQFSHQHALELMKKALGIAKQNADANVTPGKQHEATRLIAFHLPQYHPIPENDEWWGEGFTDWTNVKKARPLFNGHHQPHEPADLGYYDLREESTRSAQATLASQYGIGGFCYYHYWFNGRRLLEQPVEAILSSGEPDFPFCLCWANENWTRRWDGDEHQVLMQQNYSDEDDREHIRSLIPVFQDKRYIQFEGKPLFLVYRTGDMPDPARTASIWREEAHKAGIGDLYLCHVESLEKRDPADIGFDAAIEFAPDWKNKGPRINEETRIQAGISAELSRDNYIHPYASLVNEMMIKEAPAHTWFRCVTPSWDNTARRKTGANIFLDANPDDFGLWLKAALADTHARMPGQESLLFINAWNEWAEGCHLEPDQQFGHGNLEAVKNAVKEHRAEFGLDDTRNEIARIKRRAAKDRYQLDLMNRRLEQSRRLIAEMQASTSWRITRPVRWLKEKWLAMGRSGKGK